MVNNYCNVIDARFVLPQKRSGQTYGRQDGRVVTSSLLQKIESRRIWIRLAGLSYMRTKDFLKEVREMEK